MAWDDTEPTGSIPQEPRPLGEALARLMARSPDRSAFLSDGLAVVADRVGASAAALYRQPSPQTGEAPLTTSGPWAQLSQPQDSVTLHTSPMTLHGQPLGRLCLAFNHSAVVDIAAIDERLTPALPLFATALSDAAPSPMANVIAVLAAGTAHELNNPLTGVVGFAQLLQEADLPNPAPRYLGMIVEQVRRCQGVISSLLLFGQVAPSRPEAVHLSNLVQKVWDNGDLDWHAGHIVFTIQAEEDTPPVWIDRGMAKRAVHEILSNAVQAMGDGGVITAEIIAPGDGEPSVTLRVIDQGHGISEVILGQVLNPFFTTREVGQGSGMGLSVAAGIIRQHGGHLSVSSTLWEGTTVQILLPTVPTGGD